MLVVGTLMKKALEEGTKRLLIGAGALAVGVGVGVGIDRMVKQQKPSKDVQNDKKEDVQNDKKEDVQNDKKEDEK